MEKKLSESVERVGFDTYACATMEYHKDDGGAYWDFYFTMHDRVNTSTVTRISACDIHPKDLKALGDMFTKLSYKFEAAIEAENAEADGN